jgi:hypothetical protein
VHIPEYAAMRHAERELQLGSELPTFGVRAYVSTAAAAGTLSDGGAKWKVPAANTTTACRAGLLHLSWPCMNESNNANG